MTPGWFHVQRLAPGVWQLTEPGHVCCWVVAGSERAVVVDTGCGFVPIRPVVEALTALPVTVVNTHHHVDHVGGDHEFDEVLIHAEGLAGLAAGISAERLAGYRDHAIAMVAAATVHTPGHSPADVSLGTAVDEAAFDGFSFLLPRGWTPSPATSAVLENA